MSKDKSTSNVTKEELDAMTTKLNKERENQLRIVVQGIYGNRITTYIKHEHFDNVMLGHLDNTTSLLKSDKVDRTIIEIPNTENIVLVYNKYKEAEVLQKKEKYNIKPSAYIPEKNIELYSRCIVCRLNEDKTFASLTNEDYDKFMKYLAE